MLCLDFSGTGSVDTYEHDHAVTTSRPSVGLSISVSNSSSSASVNGTKPHDQRLAAHANPAIPTLTIPDPAAMITYSVSIVPIPRT